MLDSDSQAGTGPSGGGLPKTGRNLRLVAFYLGVPLVVAVYGALNNWNLLESAGYYATLGFYIAHALIPWWITCGSTSFAMWALSSFKPSPWVLLAIGAIAGAFITLPYSNWLTALTGAEWQDPSLDRQVAPVFSLDFWRYMLRATIVWFAVNFAFDRFLGLPRYRYVLPRGYDFRAGLPSASNITADSRLPAFAGRIPAKLTCDDILAIKAEQHYIRVFTRGQQYMVLYRFSDAIRELDPALGLQVHRSYWVGRSGIELIRPSAKKFSLKLITGDDVPVSAPHHAIVKEFARENHIPFR